MNKEIFFIFSAVIMTSYIAKSGPNLIRSLEQQVIQVNDSIGQFPHKRFQNYTDSLELYKNEKIGIPNFMIDSLLDQKSAWFFKVHEFPISLRWEIISQIEDRQLLFSLLHDLEPYKSSKDPYERVGYEGIAPFHEFSTYQLVLFRMDMIEQMRIGWKKRARYRVHR